jgi:3-dehydroquinate dehydratase I
MQPNYCLPIIKRQKVEVLAAIRDNDTDYSYFEVWLDYVEAVDETFIRQLMELAGSKLVVLFRRQNLEPIQMALSHRLAILRQLDKSQLLVDLDIMSQTAELDFIKAEQLGMKLITSYHDYQKTPESVRLRTIIDTMVRYNPSIYKLATRCESELDAVRLLELLLVLKQRGLAYVVLGSGEFGKVTRIFGTLWGNQMIFAPRIQAEQSDAGQLTRDELEIIFKTIGN